jgi:TetR/AcrR family transcriptional regulator, transcriptional repressor of aconitase
VPKLTPARAKAQRDRILDAALTCFARQGFHAATMQDIVGESGLSPGAIYGYFAGKTDMVTAIASERHQMERRRMEYALAASSLEASLRRLLEEFVLELRDPREKLWRRLAVQLWAESLSNPALRREALLGVEQAIEALSRLIRKAQKEGRWPPHLNPASASRIMISILQGISLQWAWDDKIDIASFATALQIMIVPPAAMRQSQRAARRPSS